MVERSALREDRLFHVSPIGVKQHNEGDFVLYIFKVEAYEMSFYIVDRYSSMDSWQADFKKRFGRVVQQIQFPHKRLLGFGSQNFIKQRNGDLAEFLSDLFSHPIFDLGNTIEIWTYFERHLYRPVDFFLFD